MWHVRQRRIAADSGHQFELLVLGGFDGNAPQRVLRHGLYHAGLERQRALSAQAGDKAGALRLRLQSVQLSRRDLKS